MDDPPDRAGLHQFPRLDGGARLEPFGKADRIDAPGLFLHLPHLIELRERRHARLVGHHVLAETHRANAQRRAVGRDRGGDEQLDRRILEHLFLGSGAPRSRIAPGELLGKRRIGFEERDEFRAGVRDALDLPVDVPVVGADDAEAEGFLVHIVHRQRLSPDMAIPWIRKRWQNRKIANRGTSESTDIANSGPQSLRPVSSTKVRNASGTV